ncbi:hypothetical protein [Sphingomonas sp.]|jgi:hypothetical protein|uniref:hypothetical protein n=1 Tax=Sphingomonas sp. TaxID=28214 RepID=UPI002D7EE821|nr:hypothetical protein [Sphingomonas sp.]HEU0045464.1 hypothetical protein [Sphingomonas sp.]
MTAKCRLADIPTEQKSVYVRGYVVRDSTKRDGRVGSDEDIDPLPLSAWTLTFDCETGTDAAQALKFGAYQLRRHGVLAKRGAGLFYAEDIAAAELEILRAVAEERGLRLLTVRQFVNWIMLDKIYLTGGAVIGFNLPFDISRIAIDHGSARKSNKGGFSFKLSTNTDLPRVIVKHVSPRLAFIRFGAPPKKLTPDGQAERGLTVKPPRGSFVDVKTLAAGLLSGGWSLATLSEALQVAHLKVETEEHGGPVTPEYVGYALNDVQATWECYAALATRLKGYGLSTIEPKTLYSEASLGKAYLRQMAIQPWREVQPDFPREMIGQIISTYFGGRAEVNIRREKRQVLYCDFLSMYPTVCTLMGLWRFVIANGMQWHDATAETQAMLDRVEAADLLRKDAWCELTTLVQLRPTDDILPVRAHYGQDTTSNIGVNRVTSAEPLWYTLADVIAGKLLGGGKVPVIDRAIRFDAGKAQSDLQPIDIAGKPEFRVEPAQSDFYRSVIDLRQQVKAAREKMPDTATADRARLNSEQLALKILANATSYGIFIEMIVNDLGKAETLRGYGGEGREFPVTTNKYEEPGSYFHPLLATLITGAARLMLALAERRTVDEGLDWVFCDTDSIAIAKPVGMERAPFMAAALRVRDSFAGLNPYAVQGGSILQVESQNHAVHDKANADLAGAPPLYCFAVSSKRYALFNDGEDGQPVVRKASAHGLGHLLPPYRDPDLKRRAERLEQIGVDLWQEDLWKRIIVAAEHPQASEGGLVIVLDSDDLLSGPVASRYAATTPALLRWFKDYNRSKPAGERVRPFGFLLSLQAHNLESLAHRDPEALAWWRKYKRGPAATAPYDRDPAKAASQAFDRRHRNLSVPRRWLMSYADALSDYHLQPENKFLGGELRRDGGQLQRRHVVVTGAQSIGKEAERWEEQLFIGDDDAEILYGLSPETRAAHLETIRLARQRFSVRKFTKSC